MTFYAIRGPRALSDAVGQRQHQTDVIQRERETRDRDAYSRFRVGEAEAVAENALKLRIVLVASGAAAFIASLDVDARR